MDFLFCSSADRALFTFAQEIEREKEQRKHEKVAAIIYILPRE